MSGGGSISSAPRIGRLRPGALTHAWLQVDVAGGYLSLCKRSRTNYEPTWLAMPSERVCANCMGRLRLRLLSSHQEDDICQHLENKLADDLGI